MEDYVVFSRKEICGTHSLEITYAGVSGCKAASSDVCKLCTTTRKRRIEALDGQPQHHTFDDTFAGKIRIIMTPPSESRSS